MDVESITRETVKNWSDETERSKLLSALASQPTDLSHASPLAACICVLLESLAVPESGDAASLTPAQVAAFLDEVKQSFPSSSSEETATTTTEQTQYSELILDLIWTIDSSAEDQMAEITASIKAEWQAAKDAAKDDAMEVDGKEVKAPVAKDDKPPTKSENPEVEKMRLSLEGHRRALAELLKELVAVKHVVAHSLAVERLEQPILISAGLVRSGPLFEKKTRQTRTNLFYKQTKFNLLREESEGYSKLIVELLSHHDQPASFTWQRVVSLIGFFDLDPHRVLDLIFDVMESTIMTKWRWFLDLLREAGWARTVVSTKGKEKESSELPEEWLAPSRYDGKGIEEILKENETCDSLNVGMDSKVMDIPAQLLGFKFSNHVHNQPDTPSAPRKELYLMVAILIREGVVSLPALYPHLYPIEEDMKIVEEKYIKTLKEQALAKRTNNALTRAAPLSEEPDRPGAYRARTTTAAAASAAPTTAPTGPRKPDPPNHKMGLLRALLSVGALRPALWILTKHPWMYGPFPALADLYLRLLECSLEPLYSRISLASQYPDEASSLSTPAIGSAAVAAPKIVLTDLAPEAPRSAGVVFTFFYDHWADWVPLCRTSGDIQVVFEPLLRFIGVHFYRNVVLMTKLARLGKEILESEGTDSPAKEFWRYMLTTYLLPALSFQRADQAFSSELWSFVKLYRITDRWQMYAQWKEVYTTSQEMRNRHAEISRAVKDILRRVSALPNPDRTDRKQYDEALTRVKQTARDFCKFAHTNPCIAFASLVDQIEGYGRDDNGHFVEMLKLLAPLSYDVFLYQIVSELASTGDKVTVKEDGVTPADWLQGLAGFIGHLGYGVRPGTFEFQALFKVLANNLKSNELYNLVVLEELIHKMTGIEALGNLSDAQVLAMAGGKNLRVEGVSTSIFGVLATKPLAFQKSSQRFLDLLQSSEYALPLLILLAQARQMCCLAADDRDPPKKLADLFDTCQRILFQFIAFFSTDMSPEAYSSFVPSLKDLCVTYHIDPSVAWHMLRPKLSAAVTVRTQADAAAEREAQLREKAKAQAIAAKAEPSPPPKTADQTPSEAPASKDAMEVDVKIEEATPAPLEPKPAPTPAEGESKEGPTVNGHVPAEGTPTDEGEKPVVPVWHPELEPLFDDVKALLPEDVLRRIGPAFYATFWQLSLYDIYNLGERYSQEITRMKRLDGEYKSQIKQYGELKDWVKKEYDIAKRWNDMHPHDRPKELPMIPADFPIQTDRQLSNVEKALPKFSQMSRSLLQESKDQTSWIGLTRRRLQKEKDHWFEHISTQDERSQANYMVIQYCILPRALISPMDASFCAKFVKHMHTIGTKNYMTLRMYDKIFSDQLPSIVFSCTEMEIRNYSRMLLEMLVDLHAWYNDKDKYTQEAQGLEKGPDKGPLPGFQKRWPTGTDQVKSTDLLTHPEFQRLVSKFHLMLSNTFVKCLESQEYMHVRNGILLMVKLLPVFPLHQMSLRPHAPFGVTIEERLQSYIAVETRHELKLAASGYADMLKQRKKEWSPPAPIIAPAAAETAKATAAKAPTSKAPATAPATGAPTGPRKADPPKGPSGAHVNGTTAASTATSQAQTAKPTGPPVAPKASAVPAGTPTGPASQARGPHAAPASAAQKPSTPAAAGRPSSTPASLPVRAAPDHAAKPDAVRSSTQGNTSAQPPVAPAQATGPKSSEAAKDPANHSNGTVSTNAAAVPTGPAASTGPASRPATQPTPTAPRPSAGAPVANGVAKDAPPSTTNSAPTVPAQSGARSETNAAPASQSIRRADTQATGPPPTADTSKNPDQGTASSALATAIVAPSAASTPAAGASGGVAPPRDLPQRPAASSRPLSPPPRGPAGRRRSRSPPPRGGPPGDRPDEPRDVRSRPDRDERDRYPRAPEAGRERLAPRDYPPRGGRGDLYRPGEGYPDERRDGRYPDRPDAHAREPDRTPRDRERTSDRDRDRDERDRGRDRGRERDERDRPPPIRTDLPLKGEDEAGRRSSLDDSKGRKRAHDQDDAPEARESKRHRRGRDRPRERDDRTPSDKAEGRRGERERDRDRDRRRDDGRKEDDKASGGNAATPITPSSGPPPSGPRAMNRSGPPSPPQPTSATTRRDGPADRPPPPARADSSYGPSALPARPPESGPRRDDRPRSPPRGSLVDRLGPRRDGEPGGDQDGDRSGRKRGYSEREPEPRDDSDSRDPNKRARRIDRTGAREREQNKSRIFGMAMGEAQKQDGGRSSRGRRGGDA